MSNKSMSPLVAVLALAVIATPAFAKKPVDDGQDLPKGLQKKVARGGSLPPGWQAKLQKGEVLETALMSQGEPVPEQVRVTLPAGEAGSVDITLDGKVVRINEKTRVILEVFDLLSQ